MPFGITFNYAGNSKVPSHYAALFETGIYGRLMDEIRSRLNFRRVRAGKFTPPSNKMTLDGCIATLFILWGAVASLGLFSFGVECRIEYKFGFGVSFKVFISTKIMSFCRYFKRTWVFDLGIKI